MKITFVVPTLNLSGGLRVIAVYANLLAEKGHQVSVISPGQKQPSLKEKFKALVKWRNFAIKNTFDASFFNNPAVNIMLLDTYRPVAANDVPDGDIIIATYWNTAEWIADFPASKGKKIYFIQHYEIHPWLPVDRVKATLQLPFKKIAVAQWITDILASEYGDNDITTVPNGVDSGQFHSPMRNKQPIPTVGVMYSSKTFKGLDIALEALITAKKTIPNLKLIAFGSEQPSQRLPLPENAQFYFRPGQEELRDLYGSCDAWLFSSRFEGFGLPILEAMACRTPVIATGAGAAPELVNHTNGFLVEVNDAAKMADAIIKIATIPNDEWLHLSQNAYKTSLKHSWSESIDHFERALLDFGSVNK
ncbi:MAG: glycosyltransferase family 4 protein [Methyloglobulus sp.]|nr:glycosyltransferase family 4 protein [Methyloglobulus sp.]